MSNKLGKTIRILRQAKELTVTDVANGSGVSVPYLSLVENGARQPSLEVMRRIAATLDVPSEALVIMGMGGTALKPSSKKTAELTDAVGRLMEIEKKLSALLTKESGRASKQN